MRNSIKVAIGSIVAISLLPAFAEDTDSGIDMDKVSYAMGMDLGSMLKQQDLGITAEQFSLGMKDAMAGTPTMNREEARSILQAFETKMRSKAEVRMNEVGGENLVEGAAFLEANKAKDGVQVTDSGLQYTITEAGEGDSPSATSEVTVHYTGKLLDGSVFDSSVERGEPATFVLNRVIPGWTEGLQLMKPGSKYTFYIPAELAYGDRGAPPRIGPNSTLIFDVELISVQ